MHKKQPLWWAAALLAHLGAVHGCSATKVPAPIASTAPEMIAPSPTLSPGVVASPTGATPANDRNMSKVDATGTTVVVDVPADEVCHSKKMSLTKAVFEACLINGLTLVQVSNVIGDEGDLVGHSGNVQIRRWMNVEKILFCTFRDGKLISKSQVNLK